MRLIIHADDFGMAKSINAACIELGNLGTLSSVSVMANMPFLDEVPKLLGVDHLSMGLHSTFTQGKPLSKPGRIDSLLDDNGNFLTYPVLMKQAWLGKVDADQVYCELEKQYQTLFELVGERLVFIDSHHSLHNKLLPFVNAFVRLGERYPIRAVRTRQYCYLERSGQRVVLRSPGFRNLGRYGFRKVAINAFYRFIAWRYSGLFEVPDGMLVQNQPGAAGVLRDLPRINQDDEPEGVFYAVVHPALRTRDLPASNLKEERVEEFKILSSRNFLNWVEANPLTNFAEMGQE